MSIIKRNTRTQYLLEAKIYSSSTNRKTHPSKINDKESMEKLVTIRYNFEHLKDDELNYLYQRRLNQKLKENIYREIKTLF